MQQLHSQMPQRNSFSIWTKYPPQNCDWSKGLCHFISIKLAIRIEACCANQLQTAARRTHAPKSKLSHRLSSPSTTTLSAGRDPPKKNACACPTPNAKPTPNAPSGLPHQWRFCHQSPTWIASMHQPSDLAMIAAFPAGSLPELLGPCGHTWRRNGPDSISPLGF